MPELGLLPRCSLSHVTCPGGGPSWAVPIRAGRTMGWEAKTLAAAPLLTSGAAPLPALDTAPLPPSSLSCSHQRQPEGPPHRVPPPTVQQLPGGGRQGEAGCRHAEVPDQHLHQRAGEPAEQNGSAARGRRDTGTPSPAASEQSPGWLASPLSVFLPLQRE